MAYGIELSDLYVELIMIRQMSFRDAVREARSHDSGYADVRAVH